MFQSCCAIRVSLGLQLHAADCRLQLITLPLQDLLSWNREHKINWLRCRCGMCYFPTGSMQGRPPHPFPPTRSRKRRFHLSYVHFYVSETRPGSKSVARITYPTKDTPFEVCMMSTSRPITTVRHSAWPCSTTCLSAPVGNEARTASAAVPAERHSPGRGSHRNHHPPPAPLERHRHIR